MIAQLQANTTQPASDSINEQDCVKCTAKESKIRDLGTSCRVQLVYILSYCMRFLFSLGTCNTHVVIPELQSLSCLKNVMFSDKWQHFHAVRLEFRLKCRIF